MDGNMSVPTSSHMNSFLRDLYFGRIHHRRQYFNFSRLEYLDGEMGEEKFGGQKFDWILRSIYGFSSDVQY